ncbi:hypothetical protein N7535_006053, partial [Penicillium sp. DV-2018c]
MYYSTGTECANERTYCDRRMADLRVLPLLLVAFASYQLDRTNIASALTGNFAMVISIEQNTINLGNQLMFLGVIILEIPSNVILLKVRTVGARQWISAQVCVFGIIATFQIFIRNDASFLLTRALLGLAEAGFIPGAMYTLSTWYTATELTTRIAIFFFGMFGGTGTSPLLGAALLQLDGIGGLHGWQWIFLVEGLCTVLLSIALFYFLPEHKSIASASHQAHVSGNAEPSQANFEAEHTISWKLLWGTLANITRWPHFIATACVFSTWSPLTTYTPSIVMQLGFTRIEANALAAIGSLLTLPIIFFFAWLSDRSKRRGLTVITAILVYLVAVIILRLLLYRGGKWEKFGLWTIVNAFAVGYHPIHNAWIQVNCRTAEERSISIAYVMSSTVLLCTDKLTNAKGCVRKTVPGELFIGLTSALDSRDVSYIGAHGRNTDLSRWRVSSL